jgi:hypothetical protein
VALDHGDPADWRTRIEEEPQPADLDAFTTHLLRRVTCRTR